MTVGYVYVFRSARGPLKVGHTTRHPARRAAELSRVSGYRAFAPFELVDYVAVPDAHRVETEVHRILRRHRIRLSITGRRELFRCDLATAGATIRWVAAGPRPVRKRRRGRARWVALAIAAVVVWWLLAGAP